VIAAVCIVAVVALLLAYRYKRSKQTFSKNLGDQSLGDDLEMDMQNIIPSVRGRGHIIQDNELKSGEMMMEAVIRDAIIEPSATSHTNANQVWGPVQGDLSREVWRDFVNSSAETPTNQCGYEIARDDL